jgi:hypothetical protein
LRFLTTTMISVSALAITACDVDQTKEGKLPEVEVDAKGGQLPQYDVDGPSVNVTTEKKTIDVPKVNIDGPKDDNKE